jgi:hypothetical protein
MHDDQPEPELSDQLPDANAEADDPAAEPETPEDDAPPDDGYVPL